MNSYDAAVIGLGAMGSAALYQLSKRSKRVLGIDQFSPPHSLGSTHGDTRITRLAIGEGEEFIPLAIRSHEIWRELEAHSGESLLNCCGGLIIAPKVDAAQMHGEKDFLGATIRGAKKFGVEHELLSCDELISRFPLFKLTGEERGYYEKSAGYVGPEACVRVQLAQAEMRGAKIHRNERVLACEPQPGGGVRIKTDRGEYFAEQAVLSAGAWVSDFLPQEQRAPFKVLRQILCWFEIQSDYSRLTPEHCPIFIWNFSGKDELGVYGFPAIDGPAGGLKIGGVLAEDATTPETVNRVVSEKETAAFYETLIKGRFPPLSSTCKKSLTCFYTSTPDWGFVIDRLPGCEQIVVASPCSGHGFKHSAAIGESLAQMICDGRSSIDLSKFSFARFR